MTAFLSTPFSMAYNLRIVGPCKEDYTHIQNHPCRLEYTDHHSNMDFEHKDLLWKQMLKYYRTLNEAMSQ